MKNQEQQGPQPLLNQESFSNPAETPKEQILALKYKVLSFIQDIEDILKQPLLTNHPEFLDKIAADIVALHQLSLLSTTSYDLLNETRTLINNLLNCKVLIEEDHAEMSTFDAAKIYRRNKTNKHSLSSILQAYNHEKQEAKTLIQELKLLAFDLNVEMGNT